MGAWLSCVRNGALRDIESGVSDDESLSGASSVPLGGIESDVPHNELIRAGGEDAILKPNHKVFLSHSGAQNFFVEHLCVELERCFRFPFFDKRWESLPIGENFPRHIFAAIKQCIVGVVILSEEFFTSKWPMMELVAMVERAETDDEFIIMPIFFRTFVEEFKDPKNRSRWERHWGKLALKYPTRIEVRKWQDALNYLNPVNGLEYHGASEVEFQNLIIDAICRVVPAGIKLEDSYIQGRSRLCKVIQDKIDVLQNSTINGICVLGLYGVGGIGKTSICKALCNEYFTKFRGRVCLAELEKFEKGSKEELLREVIQCLSGTNLEHLNAYQLESGLIDGTFFKEAVFLILDNLLYSTPSIEQVKRYLLARLPLGSIVMVTARSKTLLLYLRHINESNCIEMPELNMEEAHALFIKSCEFEKDDEVNEHLIESCIMRCCFRKDNHSQKEYSDCDLFLSASYDSDSDCDRYYKKTRLKDHHIHPLALHVLGTQLGSIAPYEWGAQLRMIDEDVFNQSREHDHPIFSILRKSFDILSQEDQLLFIDAALFLPDPVQGGCNVFEWLGMVHGIPHVNDVKRRLETLKKKSLLESLGDGTKASIGMHDLWRSFCIAEAGHGRLGCRRWAYVALASSFNELLYTTPTGIWQNVERIAFIGFSALPLTMRFPDAECLLAEANFAHFPNVSVLKATNLRMRRSSVLDLPRLNNLRSLEISGTNLGMLAPKGLPRGLVFLSFKWDVLEVLEPDFSRHFLEEIECLQELKCLELVKFGGNQLPNMSSMTSLSKAIFRSCSNVTTLSRLGPNLRLLDLRWCAKLQTCAGVDALEELNCRGCCKLESLPDLRKLRNLRKLDLSECDNINELVGVEGLLALVELHAGSSNNPEQSINFELPDMRNLRNLQVLHFGNRRLEALPGFGSLLSLRELVADFRYVVDKPSLHHLTKLRKLKIDGWCLEGLSGLEKLHRLEIGSCCTDHLPDLSSLVNLKSVKIVDCDFTDVHGLRNTSALERLQIERCTNLKSSVRRFSSLPRLKLLEIRACPVFEGWKPSIEADPSGLQTLTLWRCQQVTNVASASFSRLETLDCWEIGIRELPDLITMPLLRHLTLWKCKPLETITSSEPHYALSFLLIHGCCKLSTLPDLGCSFPGLLELRLEHCSNITTVRCSVPLARLQRLAGQVRTLPDLGVYFPALTKLELGGTPGLTALRSSVPLHALQLLEIPKCRDLEEVPDLKMFPALQQLDLLQCSRFSALSSSEPLPALRSLDARGTRVTPHDIDTLRALCDPACVIQRIDHSGLL